MDDSVDDDAVAAAVAALEQHPAPPPPAPDTIDPSFLRYGTHVVLRSGVPSAGHVNVGDAGLAVDGSAVGHDRQHFVITNSLYTADRGNVMFSDTLCFKSVSCGHYLSVDPATGHLRLRHSYAPGAADKWTVTPSSAPPSASAGSVGGLERVLAGLVAPAKGAVRACAPVCLRSATGRFLSVQPADSGDHVHHGLCVATMRAELPSAAQAADTRADASLTWHLVAAHVPFTAPWALGRPLLTGRAVLEANPERAVVTDKLQPLSSFSVPVQEELLVQDLLDAFLGIDGRYIAARARDDDGATPLHGGGLESVEFVLAGSGRGAAVAAGADGTADDAADVDPSLAYLVRRMLPTARHYVRCAWFVERRSLPESGLTAQALAAAARVYLQEHMLVVVQLEDLSRSGSRLTLQEMSFHTTASARALRGLDTILSAAPFAVGGQLLSSLAGFRYHPEFKAMALFLLECAAAPMLTRLEQWMFHGVIDDPHQEFMVHSRDDLDKEALKEDYNAVYWDERYTVRQSQVPTFLQAHADAILTTGKYLNAVRLCGMVIDCPFAAPIPFGSEEKDYAGIVQRAYRFSTATLLDHLMGTAQLMERLAVIKNYFFLQQADFLTHFMDLAHEELHKEVQLPSVPPPSGPASLRGSSSGVLGAGAGAGAVAGGGGGADAGAAAEDGGSGVDVDVDTRRVISLQRLRSLLEISLRSSVAVSDPFIDDLTCSLERCALMDHLEAIHHYTEGDRPPPSTSVTTTGYHVFTLDYSVRWPLSIVLSKRSLTKYQLLFRHLFWCKYVERQLSDAWMFQTKHERGNTPRVSLSMSYALRHRMLHLMQNLIYYMTFEVLQPQWNDMMAALARASTIDDVLQVHDKALDRCLEQCLLTDHALVKVLNDLTTLCLYFADHLRKLDYSVTTDVEQRKLQRTIERSQGVFNDSLKQFLTMLLHHKQSSKDDRSPALSLCARLDYNGFYSAELGFTTV